MENKRRLIALTGGPGAGKTAVIEVIRRHLTQAVAVVPEAASMVFSGGFPRSETQTGRKAAQCVIFHTQRQLERLALEPGGPDVVLCDRGTVDAIAYWPDVPETLWDEVGSTHDQELARYHAVIHLQSPCENSGYQRDSNPHRTETASEARALDEAIQRAWSDHPRRVVIPATASFLDKLTLALDALRTVIRDDGPDPAP
jgi:predicted ATPase